MVLYSVGRCLCCLSGFSGCGGCVLLVSRLVLVWVFGECDIVLDRVLVGCMVCSRRWVSGDSSSVVMVSG